MRQVVLNFLVTVKAAPHERLFVMFGLILCAPSTIFQLNRDGSSWVEPVLMRLAQGPQRSDACEA